MSTPISSPASSRASRSLSHSPRNSPKIDFETTPRSKVAALLAQFDDSSSDEQAKPTRPTITPRSPGSPSARRQSPKEILESDDDDDVLPIARSRGRTANTVQRQVSNKTSEITMDVNSTSDGMSAIDRVRKSLFGDGSKRRQDKSEDASDDEDIIPKERRRLITKRISSPLHSPTKSLSDAVSEEGDITLQPSSDNSEKSSRPGNDKKVQFKKTTRKSKKTKPHRVPRTNNASEVETRSSSDSDNGSIGSLESGDLLDDLIKESKLLQLVNKKKQKNQAKEAEDKAKRAEKALDDLAADNDSFSGNSDDEDGKRLGQKGRRTGVRKASKKAQFEMQSETQRMVRNMNCQIELPPKEVHTIADLNALFGFYPSGTSQVGKEASKETDNTQLSASSALNTSEVDQSSPPSSFTVSPQKEIPIPIGEDQSMEDHLITDENDLPSLEELMKESQNVQEAKSINKGKEKAVDLDILMADVPPVSDIRFLSKDKSVRPASSKKSTKNFSAILSKVMTAKHDNSDSDDLEVVESLPLIKREISLGAKTPDKALKDLRRLAGVDSPQKMSARGRYGKTGGSKTAFKDLMADLQKKSNIQIRQAEEELKQELRAKGKYVPTAEEKMQDDATVEDLMEKARTEALAQREREKREEAREKGVRLADLSDDSDEDDEDWLGSGEDEDQIQLSGSEDEDEQLVEDSNAEDDAENSDAEVEDPSGSPSSAQRPSSPIRLSDMPAMPDFDSEEDDTKEMARVPVMPRRQRTRAVVSDDEGDGVPTTTNSITQISSSIKSPQKPAPFANLKAGSLPLALTQMFNSSMDSQTIASSMTEQKKEHIPLGGLGVQAPIMGLTQMFECSGDETQSENILVDKEVTDRMDALRGEIPEDLDLSQIPLEPVVRNSQMETQGPFIDLSYSQSQILYEPESVMQPVFGFQDTQISELPDPTPDTGFQYCSAMAPPRFLERTETMESTGSFTGKDSVPSGVTEPTVIISPEKEVIVKTRKGRLVRRNQQQSSENDSSEMSEDENEAELSSSEIPLNAFDALRKGRKKIPYEKETFDKRQSNAKKMFEEAAEESEDEYAGLGGASDEEDDDDDASIIEELIDDDTKDVDDRQHAEYYTKRAMAEDEKDVKKLMHDITHGNLRKHRSNAYDLADSDDEEYRREKARRRNMARRRQRLLEDQNISQLANNPKRQAFLAAIDGGDKEEQTSFLDDDADDDIFSTIADIQPANSQATEIVPDSQPNVELSVEVNVPVITRQNPRRTGMKRKPTRVEVQRSVSLLLDDGNTMQDGYVSSDDDLEIVQDLESMNKRRKMMMPVIDRVAVKRSSTTISESAKMAFHTTTDPTGTFKIPQLLRRATTQVTSESMGSAPKISAETTTSMKRTTGLSASINFQQRQSAKQKGVEKIVNSKKKEEKKMMDVRRVRAAGVFNTGGFS